MTAHSPIRILHLTWSADKAGMLTDLVTVQSGDPGLELDVCFGTKGEGIFAEKIERLGIRPRILGMRSRYALLENLRGCLKLHRIIREGAYDVIHLQEALIPFPFLSAVFSSSRAKIILHNRGEFNYTETRLQRIAQQVKKAAYRLLVPGNVDRLICNSRFTVGQTPLPPECLAKAEVLYNAIDLVETGRIVRDKAELRKKLRAELGVSEDAFLVTVVARLVEFKRIDRFIAAFTTALRTEPDLTALIVGAGPMREGLESKLNAAGMTDRVRLLGHRLDAKSITAASDLFVLPSAGEAFGIAALEAVALEVPIIVFADAGGPLEFVTDGSNGFVVPDENTLAERIVACRRGMAACSAASEERPACGDIVNYARRIREIYGELLG